MKHQEITHESLAMLMDIFYSKIRANKQGLGDVFIQAIGSDDASWDAHKEKIGNFWANILLGDRQYQGHPLRTHMHLPPFPQEFFGIWLGLFDESLSQVYEEPAKTIILQKAQLIASKFQSILYASSSNRSIQ